MGNIARLRNFVLDMTRPVERHGAGEPRLLDEGARLLRGLLIGPALWLINYVLILY